MKRTEEPNILHTLPREPHVTLLARDNSDISAPHLLAHSPKHGLFVSDRVTRAIYRIAPSGQVTTLLPAQATVSPDRLAPVDVAVEQSSPTDLSRGALKSSSEMPAQDDTAKDKPPRESLSHFSSSALLDQVVVDSGAICASALAYHPGLEALLITDASQHVVHGISLIEYSAASAAPKQPDVAALNFADYATATTGLEYGAIFTFAGAPTAQKRKLGWRDGVLRKARFASPSGICVTMWHDVLISDTENHVIRLIQGEKVSTYAGDGTKGFRDGEKKNARFASPCALVCTPQCLVCVCDTENRRIRVIDQAGEVSTLAGSGEEGIDDGDHLSASFFLPQRLSLTPYGDLIVADHHIRVIQVHASVTTLAESSQQYVQVRNEVCSVAAPKKSLSLLLLDILAMRPKAPHRRVVTTTQQRRFVLSHSHDADYTLDDEELVDEHTSFSYVGDLLVTPDGTLVFTDPESHSIKQILGLNKLMYPYHRRKKAPPTFCESPFVSPNALRIHRLEKIDLSRLLDENPFSDYDIPITVEGGEIQTFHAHMVLLFLVCPALLSNSTIQALNNLSPPSICIEALLTFIYADRLPSETEPRFWCHFYLVCRTVHLCYLAQHACFRLFKALQATESIEVALELLKEAPADKLLFDTISEYIASVEDLSSKSRRAIKRRLSHSEVAASPVVELDTKQQRARRQSASTATSTFTPSKSDDGQEDKSTQPTLHTSRSLPDLPEWPDLDIIAHGVVEQSRYVHSEMPLHQKNKIDVFGMLVHQLPTLGVMLKSAPTAKDTLLPFPELLGPDFFIHVEDAFVGCHGSVLYARWPWFAAKVDKKKNPIQKRLFAPFIPIPATYADASHSKSGRSMTSFLKKSPSSSGSTSGRRASLSTSGGYSSSGSTSSLGGSSSDSTSGVPGFFERWSMKARKSSEETRSIKVPSGTVPPSVIRGIIWYLYTNGLQKVPSTQVCAVAMAHTQDLGMTDEQDRPLPPFNSLIGHLQALLTKPITVDNCFIILSSSSNPLYPDRADEARDFMAQNIWTILEREDLRNQFMDRLDENDRATILKDVDVSRPFKPESAEESLHEEEEDAEEEEFKADLEASPYTEGGVIEMPSAECHRRHFARSSESQSGEEEESAEDQGEEST